MSTAGDTLTITRQGYGDILLVKLDPSGSFVWARHVNSSQFEGGLDVSVDAGGNPRISFRVYGSLGLDPGEVQVFVTSAAGPTLYPDRVLVTLTAAATPVIGDLDGSGLVDAADLATRLERWS